MFVIDTSIHEVTLSLFFGARGSEGTNIISRVHHIFLPETNSFFFALRCPGRGDIPWDAQFSFFLFFLFFPCKLGGST